MGIAASKGSVALFLLRIVVKQWHVGILWFCIISTTILCIITTALLYAQCIPTAFLWDRTIEGGYCWLNFTPVGLTMGAWSASMDFVLAILRKSTTSMTPVRTLLTHPSLARSHGS